MTSTGGRTPPHWVVDASNVVGSVPDGWWRDRDGAARRLVERVAAWAGTQPAGTTVTVVLDAGPDDLLQDGDVTVIRARRRGRDGADDEIVALLQRHEDPGNVVVATSDGGLIARVRALGAATEGARSFRSRLDG